MASLDGVAARIADDLDDREAWMVLADGLLDHGDARGQWINLAFGDGPVDERLALEARWHRGGPGGFQWPDARLSWRFGFVVRVQVRWAHDTLRYLAALNDHPDGLLWRSLSLSDLSVDALRRFLTAPGTDRLRTLTVASNDLGDAGLAALATSALPALTKLDVQNNRCTARGLSSLLEAPFVEKLHTLRVRNNPLGPAGGTVLGAWLGPGPATLDLTRCELEDAGLQAIAQGPLAGSVETLALGQNGLTGAHLARFTELRSVDLTRNRGLRTAHLSAAASRWTSLKLDGCGLDDASLDALVAPALRTLSMPRNPDVTCDGPRFASLGELRSLDLSGCGVETPGWHTLATALPRLERLQLNKCAIEGFAGTPRGAFPTLRALHLASNPIGEDARALADVALPALRTLRVSLCGIGGALGAWSRAPWFAQLQELDVSGQAIDPTDLRAGRSLERLDMSHTGLTGSLDVLWELPGLQILTASHNRLGNEGVFAGAGHPNLRQLNLANNALDNTPVPGRPDERLRFPRLQHLNLRVNGISPSVEAALRQTSSRVLLDADERPPSSVHEDLSGIRVLLGDDGPMNRDMVRRRLSRRGARVTAVHDDALAPKLVASQPFDVVLLQPRHDAARSWRVVRALREAHPELPVVAYCGYGQLADREAALEAGCTEYLGERMDFDRLVAVIRAHAPAAESAGA